jgi:hypothetical protein
MKVGESCSLSQGVCFGSNADNAIHRLGTNFLLFKNFECKIV